MEDRTVIARRRSAVDFEVVLAVIEMSIEETSGGLARRKSANEATGDRLRRAAYCYCEGF